MFFFLFWRNLLQCLLLVGGNPSSPRHQELGTSSFTKNSINTLKIWAVNILLTVVLLQTPLTGALFVFCVNHCFLLSTEPETVMR